MCVRLGGGGVDREIQEKLLLGGIFFDVLTLTAFVVSSVVWWAMRGCAEGFIRCCRKAPAAGL